MSVTALLTSNRPSISKVERSFSSAKNVTYYISEHGPKYIKKYYNSTIVTIKTTSSSIKKGKDLIFSNKEEQMTNTDTCLVLVFSYRVNSHGKRKPQLRNHLHHLGQYFLISIWWRRVQYYPVQTAPFL